MHGTQPDGIVRIVRDIMSGMPLPTVLRAIRNGSTPAADQLGSVYESLLGGHGDSAARGRKTNGIYYTPTSLVQHVVDHALGALLRGNETRSPERYRILDPACGCGSFLLAAYQCLLDAHEKRKGRELSARERRRILIDTIFGVDADPHAVKLARAALLLKMAMGTPEADTDLPDLGNNICCGNSLIGPDFKLPAGGRFAAACHPVDWQATFLPFRSDGAFDAVIGNPPWGQKEIDKDTEIKRYLCRRYPSSAGIFDLFRPFVELGVSLTANGGYFGMVLPDIVLLKNYQPTRRLLLDHLTLTAIDWWGKAFPEAVIDTVTIVGVKQPAPLRHRVAVTVHDPKRPMRHAIPQADFAANPRQVFNLYLTAGQRRVLDRLCDLPRLGEFFEIHEGVHSGNLRAQLFMRTAVDETCRELYFGRDELAPYRLEWKGWHIRLGVMPRRKTHQRYANLGQPQWHEREKVLVRRTGDRVVAAVDRVGRYASNNYFLVFPKKPRDVDMNGLCALLNSRFMTWYFRTIEPRQGRVFAELKIKHLREFPLPSDGRKLNELGAKRAAQPASQSSLDTAIDEWVCARFSVDPMEIR